MLRPPFRLGLGSVRPARRRAAPSPFASSAFASFAPASSSSSSSAPPSSSSSSSRLPPPAVVGTIPRGGGGVRAGQHAETTRRFTPADLRAFGSLVGDPNPIHLSAQEEGEEEERDAPPSQSPPPIVQGMLAASLFSAIFGTLVPGCVYRDQDLAFLNPVPAGIVVTARVAVTSVRHLRLPGGRGRGAAVTCATTVASEKGGEGGGEETVHVRGEARVWLPGVLEEAPPEADPS